MQNESSAEEYKSLSHEQLAELSADGDENASNELIKRFSGLVTYLARYYSDTGCQDETATQCDDFVQFGLLGLCSAMKNYSADKGAGFATYASSCIRNAMLSAARKRQKEIRDITALRIKAEEFFESSPSEEDAYLYSEKIREIRDVIENRLTDVEQTVIRMHISGMSYREISESTGKTVKAVDGALQRARRKIAALIGEGN